MVLYLAANVGGAGRSEAARGSGPDSALRQTWQEAG